MTFTTPRPVETIAMSSENLSAVLAGMHDLATDGAVSQYFKDCIVDAAAKTGTVQTGDTKNNNGAFVCFAPYDDPQIAVAIVIEKGGSGAALASTAVQVLNAYFSNTSASSAITGENTLLVKRTVSARFCLFQPLYLAERNVLCQLNGLIRAIFSSNLPLARALRCRCLVLLSPRAQARRSRAVSCLLTASLPANGDGGAYFPRRGRPCRLSRHLHAPDDVELVWYHFRLSWADGGTSCYGKKRSLRVGRGRALAAHGLRRHTQNARVVRPRRDVSDLPRPLPPR